MKSSKMAPHAHPTHFHTRMPLKLILRWTGYALAVVFLLLVLSILVLRFLVFPNIDHYKNGIAQYVSQTLQTKVTIGAIHTGWSDISPRVSLHDVDVYDQQQRPALKLKQVDTELSWLSIGLLDLRLSELTIHQPELVVRRSTQGIVYLAGVDLSGHGNPEFANWLLNQSEVNIRQANITWIDELRNAPALALTKANIQLTNSAWESLLGRHQFSLQAYPSLGTRHPVSIEGHFIGRNLSNVHQWYGELRATVKDADLSVWKPWIDYPVDLESGAGSALANLHFAQQQIDKIEVDLQLSHLHLNTPQQAEPLIAKELSGIIAWRQSQGRKTLTVQQVNMRLDTGVKVRGATGLFASSSKHKQPWIEVNFSVDELHLDTITQTLRHFTLPNGWREHLQALAPQGRVNQLKVAFAGHPEHPSEYHVSAKLHQISFQAYQHILGAENLSGSLEATHQHGHLDLNTQNAVLDLRGTLRWPIPVRQMTGQITWDIQDQTVLINAKQLRLSNPHLQGTINAAYSHRADASDYLDLAGKFSQVNAKFAHFYYPIVLGKDTLHWLDTAIVDGKAENVTVISKGKLRDFPYVNEHHRPDPKLGTFKVTADVRDAILDYGIGWPRIEELATHMLFEGNRMELNAKKGRISGNLIQHAKVVIPRLDADNPLLLINGEITGSLKQGLAFVNNSPVKQVTLGFTEHLNAIGQGQLSLDLTIPLRNLDAFTCKGKYHINHGTLLADAHIGLPELTQLQGALEFTEHSLSINKMRAEIYGSPVIFDLNTGNNKSVHIHASGRMLDSALKKLSDNPLTQAMQGSADWKGDIVIQKPAVHVNIQSNLEGMAIQLPAPLSKQATQPAMLTINKKQSQADTDNIEIQYNQLLDAKLVRRLQAGKMVVTRGEIGLNVAARIPNDNGVHLSAKLDNLNVDQWLNFFNDRTHKAGKTDEQLGFAVISKADIAIQSMTVFNRNITPVNITAMRIENGLQMRVQSQVLTGNLEWHNTQNGKLYARLKHLFIPQAQPKASSTFAKQATRQPTRAYPALDLVAEHFEIGNMKLGKLELIGYENADNWIIEKLAISDTVTFLTADGTWHHEPGNPNTFVNFQLRSDNIGKTLKAFNQPDVVKGGKATLVGQLQWPGSPHEFDASGLNGQIKLNAEKGQILKLQPGAGRLLGLLSLQSLPRRLSLDFRDLFSEGFAFDEIRGTAIASNGILRSDDFFMTGPAAEASIMGETNLKTETQLLNVKVVPHVTDSLSLAALAGGPIVGAAAFVAQKLLKDPFNKIASSNYVIGGTWDNPVELESTKKPEAPMNIAPIR